MKRRNFLTALAGIIPGVALLTKLPTDKVVYKATGRYWVNMPPRHSKSMYHAERLAFELLKQDASYRMDELAMNAFSRIKHG